MPTTPVGWRGEFVVNSTTAGDQTAPAVAALQTGGYVVVWTDAASDGSGTSIRAIVCDANGNAAAPDFQVNTTTSGHQGDARVVVLANGNFAVVWADASQSGGDTSGSAVRARIFAPDGTPLGGEILVNGGTAGDQFDPDIVARADGGFTVVWRDVDALNSMIIARDFNSSGVALTDASISYAIGVGPVVGNAQSEPAIASLASGVIAVVWTESDPARGDGSSSAVRLQLMYGAGQHIGSAISVNTTAAGPQAIAAITGLAGGGFVVTWTDGSVSGGDTSSWAIRGQVFSATGVAVGGEFLVNTTTADAQYRPAVTALADGGFVVAWEDYSQNATSSADIVAQRFDATGSAVGGEFRVNTAATGGQLFADSALLADGRFIVAWQDGSGIGDTSGYGIHLAIGDPREGFQTGAARIDVTDDGGSDVAGAFEATLATGIFAAVSGGAFTVTSGATILTFYGHGITYSGGTPTGGTVTNFRLVIDGVQIAIGWNMTMDAGALAAAAAALGGGDGAALDALLDGFTYVLMGGAGNDALDGAGGGADTAVFTGSWRDYVVTQNPDGSFALDDQRAGASDGVDVVSSVEQFRFADGTVAAAELLNDAPTDIALSAAFVADGAGAGTLVGQLTAADADDLDRFTYTLLSDPSGYFEIVGDALRVRDGATVDIGAGTTRQITVEVTDAGGLTYSEVLTLQVRPALAEWGPEFTVNAEATGSQYRPDIAVLPGGRFLVVYQEEGASVPDPGGGVRGAMFDAAGVRIGGTTGVNTSTAGNQYQPSIAVLADGRSIVTWTDQSMYSVDNRLTDIRGQFLDADGARSGPEFVVSTRVVDFQARSQVTALSGGGFFVAWEDNSKANAFNSLPQIKGQVFAADGSRVGGEFVVNSSVPGVENLPAVAALSGDRFVVTWFETGGAVGDANGGVRGQIFNGDGTRAGGEFQVNATTAGLQSDARVAALPGGGFIVAWTDTSGVGGDASMAAVRAQRFGDDGTPVGTEFLVNTTTFGRQELPSICVLPDGRFAIVWLHATNGAGNAEYQVRGQLYGSDGARDGAEFIASAGTVTNQSAPAIEALPDGRFVVSWATYVAVADDGVPFAVRAQIFDPRIDGVVLVGSSARDHYVGTSYADEMSGAGGHDTLLGGLGGDSLYGGEGNDRFDEAADGAADTMNGGYGDDFYILREAGEIVDENSPGTSGLDTVWVSFTDYTLTTGTEVGAVNFAGPAILTGEGDRNTLFGEASQDTLFGLGGSDYLYGFGADDTLYGGLGPDFLYGGSGNDTLVGGGDNDYYRLDDGGADTVVEVADGGIDQVWVNFSGHTMQANVEWGVLNFDTAGDLTGNDIDNTLYGTDGVNTLMGGGGNDNLLGYAGIDVLHGEDGDDVLQGGLDADTLYGGAGNDAFIGGGGAGNTYFGGIGDDFYRIDAAGDVVSETGGAGIDTVWVSVTVDYVAPDGIENLAANIGTALNLTGNGLDNLMQGNDAVNTLAGATGNDTLIAYDGNDVLVGGAGRDILIGGSGADTFAYGLGDGNDIIADFDFAAGDRVDLTGIVYIGNGATSDVALLSADGGLTTFTLSANNGYNWTGAEFI